MIFTFDGDAAGQKAALRAFEDDQKFAAETYIAIAPDGMDPCELRLAKGDEAVADLVEPRTPLFEFAIRQIVAALRPGDPRGPRRRAGRGRADRRPHQEQRRIQHEVAVQLAGMLGILDTQFVVKRVAQLARWARDRGGQRPRPAGRGPAAPQPYEPSAPRRPARGPALNLRSPAHRTERELLKLALQRPDLVSPAFDAYGVDEFTAPPYAAVRQAIVEAGGAEQGAAGPAGLPRPGPRGGAPTTPSAPWSPSSPSRRSTRRTVDEVYAGVQLVQVRLRAVDRRIREVQGSLARLGPPRRPRAPLAAVQNELWVLQQYAQSLRDRGARRPVAPACPRPPAVAAGHTAAVTTRSRTGLKKSPHAPRGGDVSYPTLGCGA